jgi:hypothetical protein
LADIRKFKGYFKNGYKVLRKPIIISDIDEKSFEIIKKVYNIRLDKEDILSNSDKYLILIRNTTDQKEFLTNDQDIIKIVNEQYKYQFEKVGVKIRLNYLILGGIKCHYPPNHIQVDKFVKCLNHIISGKIYKGEYPGTFNVVLSINPFNHFMIQKSIKETADLFNYISTVKRMGFQLLYYTVTPVRRLVPAPEVSKTEWMIPTLDENEINKINRKEYLKEEVLIVCKKLNQAYIEAEPIDKLVMLWSAIEKIFSSSSENLLYVSEIDSIFRFAKNIGTLKNDGKRLNKFKSLIGDKEVFHKESRNDVISKKIQNLLKNEKYYEIKKKIRKASSLRGKYLHNLKNNEIIEIRELNIFLENVLQNYIETRIEGGLKG